MSTHPKLVGLYGGTFDPIHNGHLNIIHNLIHHYHLHHIEIIPNQHPPHRQAPKAATHHRLSMMSLAIQTYPQCHLNLCEIHRKGPSYTADTVTHLKKNSFPNDHLAWILGEDAFRSFTNWHRYESILEKCHLILINRTSPNQNINKDITPLSHLITNEITDCLEKPSGKILRINIPEAQTSSTDIRKKVRLQQSINNDCPQAVVDYIHTHHLYQKKTTPTKGQSPH